MNNNKIRNNKIDATLIKIVTTDLDIDIKNNYLCAIELN